MIRYRTQNSMKTAMTPSADKIASSCNSIKPAMNTKKAPVKKEEVPVFLKKVSAVI